MTTFTGFTKNGLALLDRLPSFDKEGFAQVKTDYAKDIAQPAKAFVDALGGELRDRVSPAIRFEAKTNGSISPINNDLRFNPEATLYKDHLLFRFWEGDAKRAAPTLFVRLAAGEVGFAVGSTMEAIDRARAAIDVDGDGLQQAIASVLTATKGELVGSNLKRVPSPYPADHPHGDLLRHTWIQIRWVTRLVRTGPGLVQRCVEQLTKAAPVHSWLVRNKV